MPSRSLTLDDTDYSTGISPDFFLFSVGLGALDFAALMWIRSLFAVCTQLFLQCPSSAVNYNIHMISTSNSYLCTHVSCTKVRYLIQRSVVLTLKGLWHPPMEFSGPISGTALLCAKQITCSMQPNLFSQLLLRQSLFHAPAHVDHLAALEQALGM